MFYSQQEKYLLSGDDRAVFEMIRHGAPPTDGFRVQRLWVMKDGYCSGCEVHGLTLRNNIEDEDKVKINISYSLFKSGRPSCV